MIKEFMQENINSLNIITIPYNSSEILKDIILNFYEKGNKILYITNEFQEDIDIVKFIEDKVDISIYKGEFSVIGNFIITNYNNARKLGHLFDLVIYNDIRSYPLVTSYEILDIINLLLKPVGKIIYYGTQAILNGSSEVINPVRDCKIPIFEPKIISTRIDLSKDIPYVIFDYIKWSIKSCRKVIIYTPDGERTRKVYDYLLNYRDKTTKNIFRFSEIDKIDTVKNFAKSAGGILITNDFLELGINMEDCDIMVFFADDTSFDYKRLLFLACKGLRYTDKSVGEVIFLAKDETIEMDKAIGMVRSFNRKAWEMGLIL